MLKSCSKCKKEKSIEEFYKRNSNNTYFNNCKYCEKIIYHEKHKDKKRNYISCKICNKEFIYNAGLFTTHLKEDHKIFSREEYVIITEYNNVQPKCQCGFCNDDAVFISRKNKFHKINFDHRNFIWLEDQYLKKYGNPKCKNPKCDNVVKFLVELGVTAEVDVKATAEDIENSGKSPNITSYARIRTAYIEEPDLIFIILSLKHKVYSQKNTVTDLMDGIMEVVSYNAYDIKYLSAPDISYNPALGTGKIQIRDIHYVDLTVRTAWEFCQLLDKKYLASTRRSIEEWYGLAKKFHWIKIDE